MKNHMKMVLTLLAIGILLQTLSACNDSQSYDEPEVRFTIGELSYEHLEFQGIPRRFDYFIPSGFNGRRLPVMVVIHGSGYSSGMQLAEGDFVRIAEEEGFIVIGFNAVVLHNDECPYATMVRENVHGTEEWISSEGFNFDEIDVETVNVRPVALGFEAIATQGINDVAYINALVDLFIESGFGDDNRVFAAGISHGAYMATRLGVEHPERFIGIGSVAGGISQNWRNAITSEHPGRWVFIHGDRDWIVPPGAVVEGNLDAWWDFTYFRFGNDIILSAIDWVLRQHGIEPEQTGFSELEVQDVPETYPTSIERSEFNDGRAVLYWVINGGHTWPGGTQYMESWVVGPVSMHAQATNLIWDVIRVDIISETPTAVIRHLDGNQFELTVEITTVYDNDRVVTVSETKNLALSEVESVTVNVDGIDVYVWIENESVVDVNILNN